MAKLYFRYGTVGSGKTLQLLSVAHNYEQQGKKILTAKPAIDNRFGWGFIRTRAGLSRTADICVSPDSKLDFPLDEVDCILVDEVQFLAPSQIYKFRKITIENNIPVICYGLRADFRTHLFPGSETLLEVADSIEEIKTTCWYCQKKAIFNMKLIDGVPTTAGPVIELGAEEKYLPVCAACYYRRTNV